jgi:hypothetical protein
VITKADLLLIVDMLGQQALEDIAWAESLTLPSNPKVFALEAVFVICNSGMKNTVARGIYNRCEAALVAGTPVIDVFKHAGKVAAIESIWARRVHLLAEFLATAPLDRLAWIEALPWIGGITKYHLAKNYGMDVAKPDVHLQRLADREACTTQDLCARLAVETGWRIATVDTLLWRACANGVMDSRTGVIKGVQQ